MTPRFDEPLAPKTTLGIGGPARVFISAATDHDVSAAVAYARAQRLPLRIIGAGSNLLVPDEGVAAVVLSLTDTELSFAPETDGVVYATAAAGVRWDTFVDAAATRGLYGIENLAGVPGTVGGAAVQNIGAYGAAFSSVFVYADTFNTQTGEIERIHHAEAAFGYRTSIFKQRRELVILRVTVQLSTTGALMLTYPDLVRYEADKGALHTPQQAVMAIRAIRAAKFPDLSREGTAGSFFANPVLPESEAQQLAARFPGLPLFVLPESPGYAKVPLAWILEHVLHLKGFQQGSVRLYEKHALVLVAERGAHAREVNALVTEVAQRVHDATGITIAREVETFCS